VTLSDGMASIPRMSWESRGPVSISYAAVGENKHVPSAKGQDAF
jgi:hypothetical protein